MKKETKVAKENVVNTATKAVLEPPDHVDQLGLVVPQDLVDPKGLKEKEVKRVVRVTKEIVALEVHVAHKDQQDIVVKQDMVVQKVQEVNKVPGVVQEKKAHAETLKTTNADALLRN